MLGEAASNDLALQTHSPTDLQTFKSTAPHFFIEPFRSKNLNLYRCGMKLSSHFASVAIFLFPSDDSIATEREKEAVGP